MSVISSKPNEPSSDKSSGDCIETLADKMARYCSSEFTALVTRHFHQAKRKALAERDAIVAQNQNRSA
jgi:hypothetical protein